MFRWSLGSCVWLVLACSTAAVEAGVVARITEVVTVGGESTIGQVPEYVEVSFLHSSGPLVLVAVDVSEDRFGRVLWSADLTNIMWGFSAVVYEAGTWDLFSPFEALRVEVPGPLQLSRSFGTARALLLYEAPKAFTPGTTTTLTAMLDGVIDAVIFHTPNMQPVPIGVGVTVEVPHGQVALRAHDALNYLDSFVVGPVTDAPLIAGLMELTPGFHNYFPEGAMGNQPGDDPPHMPEPGAAWTLLIAAMVVPLRRRRAACCA